jgi:aflatoxin B1 aldehyde reductase
MSKSNIILGTMNIAYPCSSNPSASISEYTEIIQQYIHASDEPILDSAYYYGNTRTESILGEILPNLSKMPKLTTKANPWLHNDFTNGQFGQLSPERLEFQINASLKNMRVPKVDFFFLHCPDPETSLKLTLEKTDELWRREKYDNFGLSNFSKTQVDEVQQLCQENGYHSPSVYQGMYNIVSRKIEELFPTLHEHNMDFWAYNPLAGGILTGKYAQSSDTSSRFKDNSIYQTIFWKPEIVEPLHQIIGENTINENICVAYNWLKHHVRPTDKIILGVSSTEQFNSNIRCLESSAFSDDFLTKHREVLDSFRHCESSPSYYY